MPKIKTHSGAKKRFKATANGLYKTGKSGKSHILTKKSPKRKRGLRKSTTLTSADLKRMLRAMGK